MKKILIIMLLLIWSEPIMAWAQQNRPIDLGTAGDFTVLAESGAADGQDILIIGDVGVNGPESSLTGSFLPLNIDCSGDLSRSIIVTGKVYTHD